MNNSRPESIIIIVMGVSGCGKSTIAALMAESLNIGFLDADDLHPPENKQLMNNGIALTDANRQPWLEKVRDYAASVSANHRSCVIACSALKRAYRETLSQAPNVCYVFLDGPKSLIQQRIHDRSGHFMPESLLDSQYAALETPVGEDRVISVNIEHTPEHITSAAIKALRNSGLLK